MFTLQRGVRHDQHVLVILAFVTTCPVDGVGAGQNLLSDCLSLFPSHSSLRNTLYCNILMFRIYEGMNSARTFVTV